MMKYIIIKEREINRDIAFNTPFYISFLTKIVDFFVKRDFDFEAAIKNSKYWALEFKYNDWTYKYEVEREIGLNENKIPILKLPNTKNELGYWMDEDLDYDYFKNHFNSEEISKEDFYNLWNSLES